MNKNHPHKLLTVHLSIFFGGGRDCSYVCIVYFINFKEDGGNQQYEQIFNTSAAFLHDLNFTRFA